MDRKAFQAWLSGAEALTEAQKTEAGEILAGRPVGAASLAAIELGVGEDRRCPRCEATGAVANGKARGLQRYLCKAQFSSAGHDDPWLQAEGGMETGSRRGMGIEADEVEPAQVVGQVLGGNAAERPQGSL